MNWLKRFLYGILIGITSIAPGISGSTIAIALGFYEKLIYAIAHILKDFRKHFTFLLPFGAGAIVSIAALSVLLDYLFTNFPLPTSTLFIGLIIGTLPFIKSKIHISLNGSKFTASHLFTGIAFFMIVLIPLFVPAESVPAGSSWDPGTDSASVILFLMIGIIIAATMIIPGLSGTMILMSLGLYKPLLYTASSFVTSIVTFKFAETLDLMHAVIPMGIGFLAGGFLIAKILHKLFTKIPVYIYSAVFALICATPVVMLSEISIAEVNILNILISLITFFTGLILVKKIGDHE